MNSNSNNGELRRARAPTRSRARSHARQDLYTDEAYSIRISSPDVTIEAQSVYGALRALETLAQSVHVVSFERVFEKGSLSPRPTMNFDGDPGSVLVLNATALYDAPRWVLNSTDVCPLSDSLTRARSLVLSFARSLVRSFARSPGLTTGASCWTRRATTCPWTSSRRTWTPW